MPRRHNFARKEFEKFLLPKPCPWSCVPQVYSGMAESYIQNSLCHDPGRYLPDQCHGLRTSLTATLNKHLSSFRVMALSARRLSVVRSLSSCSSSVLPKMSVSSICTMWPGTPSSTRAMRLWKCSGAEQIPNGNFVNMKRPYGVINVVSLCDSSLNRI